MVEQISHKEYVITFRYKDTMLKAMVGNDVPEYTMRLYTKQKLSEVNQTKKELGVLMTYIKRVGYQGRPSLAELEKETL